MSASLDDLWQACGVSPLEAIKGIKADQILVYALPLNRGSAEAVRPFLSKNEKTRAISYGRELDSRRFAISRGLLRGVLGRYTGIIPGGLVFRYGPLGRPELNPDQAAGLDFNLTRRGDCCVIALGKCRRIGVDIESCNSYKLVESMMTMLMDEDRAAIERAKGLNRYERLIEAWTRLEARAKAIGVGIGELASYDRTVTCKNFKLSHEWIGCVAAEGNNWQMKLIQKDDFEKERN